MAESEQDVVAFLTAQHEQIKGLLEHVATSSGEVREQAFTELRRLLAGHETAEERLAELEQLDLDSKEFETAFVKFRHDVIQHAQAEEHEEFDQLAD